MDDGGRKTEDGRRRTEGRKPERETRWAVEGGMEVQRCKGAKVRRWPSYAPNLADLGGAWPPKTYPRPSWFPAPRMGGCPLTRGDSEGLGRESGGRWSGVGGQ